MTWRLEELEQKNLLIMTSYSTDDLFGYNMVTMLLLCTNNLQLHAFIAMELNLG